MRRAFLLMVWTGLVANAWAGNVPPQEGLAHRILKVERCWTRVAGGKATLTVGSLRRTKDAFEGDFDMKVAPYFFKNDKGKLAIRISKEAIARASAGSPIDLTGFATTMAGKNTVVRPFNALATPVDAEHGALKVWLTVDERKLVFETKYRFVEDSIASAAQPVKTAAAR
jgi:hypothetical protein